MSNFFSSSSNSLKENGISNTERKPNGGSCGVVFCVFEGRMDEVSSLINSLETFTYKS